MQSLFNPLLRVATRFLSRLGTKMDGVAPRVNLSAGLKMVEMWAMKNLKVEGVEVKNRQRNASAAGFPECPARRANIAAVLSVPRMTVRFASSLAANHNAMSAARSSRKKMCSVLDVGINGPAIDAASKTHAHADSIPAPVAASEKTVSTRV